MTLKEKTTENLENKLKLLKISTGFLAGVSSILFIICLYNLLTREDNSIFRSLIIVPSVLFTIIPIYYGNIKKIKNELNSRN
ncbi:hypothetical protein WH52_03575 [Tenacibaculum holothuriorum]|uniref:Redox-active disulfide protein 2 n=1 Tax=Tenacibaculum holothuriorum TaxID=1635173 RepID=A0A1Y2PE54_9FLAO|nr:hypothetical protein WH52_03575 [Tenacibaculum holothuriorum]